VRKYVEYESTLDSMVQSVKCNEEGYQMLRWMKLLHAEMAR
jgi:hypothetical protein